jgi:hypothetical protein
MLSSYLIFSRLNLGPLVWGPRWLSLPWRLASVIILLALGANGAAHPIHTSTADADYNPTARNLEVALRVFVDDFEAALTTREKRPISLERTPAAEFDALTRVYLAEYFTVKAADGARVTLQWIRREIKESANELWLYFEAPLPQGVDGTTIHHAILRDQFSNQINSVHIRDGARRTTLVFLPSHREKRVRFRP